MNRDDKKQKLVTFNTTNAKRVVWEYMYIIITYLARLNSGHDWCNAETF